MIIDDSAGRCVYRGRGPHQDLCDFIYSDSTVIFILLSIVCVGTA